MHSPGPSAGSLCHRWSRRIALSLGVAVVLVTAVDGVVEPSWVGSGDTSATNTTLPAGALAPQREHGVPEVAAADQRRCKTIKNKRRRRQCRKQQDDPDRSRHGSPLHNRAAARVNRHRRREDRRASRAP